MKKIIILATALSLNAMAVEESRYFTRPLSCPLRFSQLSNLRDQVQMLVSSLGNGCSREAISQLNSSVSNLEGIVNTFSSYQQSENVTASAQYAKNVGQILGSINLITSNNACFYDIRSRGVLPVLSDVIMSTSQLGLLVPSATGQVVAASGYIAGTGLKIINELVKKKFNFSKPEERRAFIQLNCAFFDNRKIMEESGLFNPESVEFRDELVNELRRERVVLLKAQKRNEETILKLEKLLDEVIASHPTALNRGLGPALSRKLEEILNSVGKKPGDLAEKLRLVSFLSENVPGVFEQVKALKLDLKTESSRKLLVQTLEKIIPDLQQGAKAWTNSIDEFEVNLRAPLFAFLSPVSAALKKDLATVEAELAVADPATASRVARLRLEVKNFQNQGWSVQLRLASLETKIASFEKSESSLFSENDEGSSSAGEILDYYRQLQRSILGKEGRDYLENALKTGYQMKDGLVRQLELMNEAKTPREKCAAAEKTRFAWAQYRYKVQEAHDFVATNLDLYRSSFRIGKERLKRATTYVLFQIDSVEAFQENRPTEEDTVGDLMADVNRRVKDVEDRLRLSGCF